MTGEPAPRPPRPHGLVPALYLAHLDRVGGAADVAVDGPTSVKEPAMTTSSIAGPIRSEPTRDRGDGAGSVLGRSPDRLHLDKELTR